MADDAAAQEHLEASFRTHANYLRAFAQLFGFGAFPLGNERANSIFETIGRTTATAFPRPKNPGNSPDLSTVTDCLNRAWGTELLLGVSRRVANEEELCRLANSWGAVQTYYVAYAATQALIVATGNARPTSHPGTQDQTTDLWVTRAGSLAPLSFAATSIASSKPHVGGFLHGPGRALSSDISTWSSCSSDTCWDIAGKALRSTRERAVTKKLDGERNSKTAARKKEWKQEEEQRIAAGKKPRKQPTFLKARLTTAEKANAERKVRPHTIVDYLFRLRIKANYEDAHMFTDGPGDSNGVSSQVALDFHRIAASVMLAHEVRIGQMVGKDWLLTAAQEWTDKNSPEWSLGVKYRLGLLGDIL